MTLSLLILTGITDRGCVFLWGGIMYLFTQPMHSSTTPCAYHTYIKNVKLWAGMTLESWSSFIPKKPMLLTKNHACGLKAWAASSLWINISQMRVRQCLIFTFCMSINRIIFPSWLIIYVNNNIIVCENEIDIFNNDWNLEAEQTANGKLMHVQSLVLVTYAVL